MNSLSKSIVTVGTHTATCPGHSNGMRRFLLHAKITPRNNNKMVLPYAKRVKPGNYTNN